MSKTAHILALKADTIEELDYGVSSSAELMLDACNTAEAWIGPRPVLETDQNFVQVIPYIVLRRPSGELLSYKRSTTGGEDRLHAKSSIGLGGHVDLTDVVCNDDGSISVPDTLDTASRRELEEECSTVLEVDPVWSHLISINGSDVDRVHLGFVGFADVTDEQVSSMVFEDAIAEPVWATAEQMLASHEQGLVAFEAWSHALLMELVHPGA